MQWSVYRWLDGDHATAGRVTDPGQFAADLADFLAALYQVDPADGPPPGQHNFFRGGPLTMNDSEARAAISALGSEIDDVRAAEVWEAAISASWHDPPAWLHGDVSPENLLVRDGRLSAVIDFGCSAVGDPACDTDIAWTFLAGQSRQVFRNRLAADEATWARGRGWSLWKAMIVLLRALKDDPADAIETKRVIREILADHEDAA